MVYHQSEPGDFEGQSLRSPSAEGVRRSRAPERDRRRQAFLKFEERRERRERSDQSERVTRRRYASATCIRLGAVVRLLAAGVGLALVRLLRHGGRRYAAERSWVQ